MTLVRRTFEQGNLLIDINQTAQRIKITWHGTSEAREPASFLTSIFDEIAKEAQGRAIELDFSPLEFMNASTLSVIMTFVKSLNVISIPTTLIFDLNVNWQRINYQCMKVISRSLKSLQVQES